MTAGRLHGVQGLYKVLRTKLYWRAQFVRFHVDLEAWPITTPSSRAGVEAREGTFEELRRFRESQPRPPIQFYADVTHGARRFYLGLADGKIGHISWVFSKGDHVRQMTLGAGDIMLDGAYTFVDFRGRGLLSAVERAALNDAKREGKRNAYTHVSTDNRASLRGVWKTGFRPAGLLMWRWVLGISIPRYVESEAMAMTAAGFDAAPAVATANA
jgi:predicted GNAT family acetyltransferase